MKSSSMKLLFLILCISITSCMTMRKVYKPESFTDDWNEAVNYRSTSGMINLSNEFRIVGERKRLTSKSTEGCPIISGDGKTLYFIRTVKNRGFFQTIMKAAIDDFGNRGKAEVFEINKEDTNNSLDYMSEENNTAIYSYNVNQPFHKFGKSNFFYFFITTKSFNVWSEPKKIFDIRLPELGGQVIASRFSDDLQYFIFSVNSHHGYGGMDIFVKIRKDNGGYAAPINLGRNVNTKGMEMGVSLAADNKTLYFSSAGHPGYGGADIYMTKRLDESWERWSKPVNLGPIINSEKHETDFVMSKDKSKGFVVVAKEGDTPSNIYFVNLE